MLNKKTLVYPQLPKAGLGNRLLVWARAILFAQMNDIPVIEPNWSNFSLGPYLRGESDKRYYRQFFELLKLKAEGKESFSYLQAIN